MKKAREKLFPIDHRHGKRCTLWIIEVPNIAAYAYQDVYVQSAS